MEAIFEGKVAIVTGAGSGIGRGSAMAFAAAGAAVVVADVSDEGGASCVADITAAGGQAIFVRADMRSTRDVEAMVGVTVDTYGRLDFAHNNAGIDVPHQPLAEVDEDDWDAILDVDLKGVWRCMKAEIPVMLRTGGGAIVNTSSMAGVVGVPGAAAYCSAKHGVVGLTKVAAIDYAAQNIRVNVLTPGLVRTPLITQLLGEAVEDIVSSRPTGRIPDPADVANAVMWLCSP
ncbi:MAG: glucose 1-dehydrogenase, partial [Acidobacteria bacterium]|nr:glucose 1-dehydrogenase [Acidobacteriota bacterium]